MNPEKIISLLEAKQGELAKQLLKGNPGLVPGVVKALVQMRETGATLFSDVIDWGFYYVSNEGWPRINFLFVPFCASTSEIIRKFSGAFRLPLTHTQDKALTTPHNIEALFRAWLEGRELRAEDFDWSMLLKLRRIEFQGVIDFLIKDEVLSFDDFQKPGTA